MAAVDDAPSELAEAPPPRPTAAASAAAFDFLCRALSQRLADPLFGPGDGDDLDWVAVVAQANREKVVGNLYIALAELGWPSAIPADLRDYLSLVYEANADQNRALRQEIGEIADILTAVGASFAFLKGANWLIEADESRIGERWLADIDLVMAPADWTSGIAAIEAAGFRPAAPLAIYERHFHHVPLARPGDRVTIELHRHLGWQRHLLTPEEVIADARPAPGFPHIRLCSPAHRFIFGSLHAQLQNMEYAAGHFSLRDLCDIQYLVAAKGDELDWPAIAVMAEERGVFRYLAASLYLASRLLGTALPPPFADSPAARRHVARCLLQHHGERRRRATALAVKIAWVLDGRRLAYESDCERAPWLLRQIRIGGGRLGSILRVLSGRRLSPDAPFGSNGELSGDGLGESIERGERKGEIGEG